jgi:hypothetical protein
MQKGAFLSKGAQTIYQRMRKCTFARCTFTYKFVSNGT